MDEELDSLMSMQAFEVVSRPINLKKGDNIFDITWAFKRKRFPDGSIKKLKAYLCARGDQQREGVDQMDTYAPVISWITVRMLLILSCVLGLKMQQVDYTSAFVQADIKDDIYLEMPRGYREKGKVLKLKKNVYGLRQAPLNFFLKLKQGLEDCHFVQSENDPCLFYSEKVICLVYVDDCLFFARDDEDIDKIIDSLKDGFLLEKETSFAGYLGIHIDR